MLVENGKRVSIEYTLRLEDQTIVDTNVGQEPLQYMQGAREIIPGLEDSLIGLDVGQSRQVIVPPEQAYGSVNPEGFHEVDNEHVPPDARKAGTMLLARDDAGNERPLRVREVRENTVLIDFNHPLAGETLFFDVKVIAVE